MTVEITRLGIDISAQAEDGTGLDSFRFMAAQRGRTAFIIGVCLRNRQSLREKPFAENLLCVRAGILAHQTDSAEPLPSLPLAQVRALNTRRIEPVPFVNNQSPMKRSTSPSIIKAKQFYSPIPCSPSLPSSRMRARGPTPSAPPPPMMLPDTIWDCNQHREIGEKRRAIKLAPKEGRGDLVDSLEELCSVMNRS